MRIQNNQKICCEDERFIQIFHSSPKAYGGSFTAHSPFVKQTQGQLLAFIQRASVLYIKSVILLVVYMLLAGHKGFNHHKTALQKSKT